MKKALLLLLAVCCCVLMMAQPLVTRNGYIGFFSKTPLEDIKAENRQVNAVLDVEKKSLAFVLLMRGFLFKKELMQQHFNENYVESNQYPKASFTGTYSGNLDIQRTGTYPVVVKGALTLHGVTRTIEVPATLEVQNNKIMGSSRFGLKPADFNIKIPSLVRDKIAQQIDVVVKADFQISK